jgi:uncharacterized protein (DUF1330 family)
MIVTCRIHDRARFLEEYGKPTAALIGRFGGRYIVRAPGAAMLENKVTGQSDGASVVISEWPNKDAIMQFWNSPEYAALKAARQPLADADVMIVEQAG